MSSQEWQAQNLDLPLVVKTENKTYDQRIFDIREVIRPGHIVSGTELQYLPVLTKFADPRNHSTFSENEMQQLEEVAKSIEDERFNRGE